MSPTLRKLLITPREETEGLEFMSLLKSTIDLTRAALARGLIFNCEEEEVDLKIYISENAFFRPYGVKSPLELITQMMKQVKIDKLSSISRWQVDEIHRPQMTRKRGVLLSNLEEEVGYDIDVNMEKFIIKPAMEGGNRNPPIETTTTPLLKTKKRELSPSETTQVGSLPKHSTRIKESLEFRKKFNKSFFEGRRVESADGSPALRHSEKRVKRTPGRKLTTIPGQSLITSIFSPKTLPPSGKRSEKLKDDQVEPPACEEMNTGGAPNGATK